MLLSHLTAALIRDQLADDVSLAERGIVQLKGFPEPTPIYALHIPGISESTASADRLRPTPFEGAEEALAARVAERQAPDAEPAETAAGLEVLLVSDSIGGVENMVGFTHLAAPGRTLRGMILTCIVDDQDDVLPTTRNLVGLRNDLAGSGLAVRVAAFHTSDAGDAIEKLVLRQEIGLVVANAAELILAGDDTLSLGILCAAPCDVALHLYRQDPGTAGPLLVPFSGSDHDWAALELATTLAVASGRTLIVTGTAGRESEAGDASRLLASASLIAQQLGGIIAEPLLIPRGADAVVEAAAGASHLITGVPVDYELRGIGRTRREIAGRTPATVTFIRRGRRTGVISPDQNVTQFAWTCTQPG